MSFDDWFEQYKLRSDWINLSEEDDIKNAYNAGLARAAEIAESYCKSLRFSQETHVGLGDIRMSIGAQENLAKAIRNEINTSTP